MGTPSGFGSPKPKMSGKRRTLLFAGGGILGLGAVLWYRRRSASNAATASPDQSGTAGFDPNAVDPATGVPYADEYGNAMGSTPGALGTYNPLTGSYTPGYGTTGQVSIPATNAQWAQAAITYLVNEGYDPVATTAAIGAYLTGIPLTTDQQAIVSAAIGVEGQPPTPAPQVGTTVPPGQTPPPPVTKPPPPPVGTVTVPNVVGKSVNTAIGILASKGLRYKSGSGNRNPLKAYVVTGESPGAGSKVTRGSTVTLTWKVKR